MSGSADHETILALISEYSEKLRSASGAYYRRKTRLVALFAGIYFGFLFGWAILYVIIRVGDTSFESSTPTSVRITVMVSGAATVLAGLASFVFSLSELRRSRFDIRPLFSALERLLFRASQLEDHLPLSHTEDQKIVLSLKIAEAESALEYADWVLHSSFVPWPWGHSRLLRMEGRQYRTRSHAL